MTRRRFHRRVYLGILKRQRLICRCEPTCDLKLTRADGYEFNHIVPLCFGGKDEPDNLAAVAVPHHKPLTREQAKQRAKANRLARGPRQRKGPPIRSRGFQKCTAPHQWPKRRMQSRGW